MPAKELPSIFEEDWFIALPPRQQELLQVTYQLYEREAADPDQLADYGFIVFSAAKAYEGFIKQYLYDLQLISKRTFEGRRFRIGRAINPDVHNNQRDEYWLYDDLERMCGKAVAQQMWETWLECRNQVFHYFPLKYAPVTLQAAGSKVAMVIETMQQAYQCQLENL